MAIEPKDLGLVSAYGAALEGGYTGTYDEYKDKMLELLNLNLESLGGTNNYLDLENKPKINNVTLEDNIALSDLKIPATVRSDRSYSYIEGNQLVSKVWQFSNSAGRNDGTYVDYMKDTDGKYVDYSNYFDFPDGTMTSDPIWGPVPVIIEYNGFIIVDILVRCIKDITLSGLNPGTFGDRKTKYRSVTLFDMTDRYNDGHNERTGKGWQGLRQEGRWAPNSTGMFPVYRNYVRCSMNVSDEAVFKTRDIKMSICTGEISNGVFRMIIPEEGWTIYKGETFYCHAIGSGNQFYFWDSKYTRPTDTEPSSFVWN